MPAVHSEKRDQPAPPPSMAWRGPQLPGEPLLRLRPVHIRLVEHVPLPPVPQQGWPSPPQVAHLLLAEPSTHCCGAVHALTPPSIAGPPMVGQHA